MFDMQDDSAVGLWSWVIIKIGIGICSPSCWESDGHNRIIHKEGRSSDIFCSKTDVTPYLHNHIHPIHWRLIVWVGIVFDDQTSKPSEIYITILTPLLIASHLFFYSLSHPVSRISISGFQYSISSAWIKLPHISSFEQLLIVFTFAEVGAYFNACALDY